MDATGGENADDNAPLERFPSFSTFLETVPPTSLSNVDDPHVDHPQTARTITNCDTISELTVSNPNSQQEMFLVCETDLPSDFDKDVLKLISSPTTATPPSGTISLQEVDPDNSPHGSPLLFAHTEDEATPRASQVIPGTALSDEVTSVGMKRQMSQQDSYQRSQRPRTRAQRAMEEPSSAGPSGSRDPRHWSNSTAADYVQGSSSGSQARWKSNRQGMVAEMGHEDEPGASRSASSSPPPRLRQRASSTLAKRQPEKTHKEATPNGFPCPGACGKFLTREGDANRHWRSSCPNNPKREKHVCPKCGARMSRRDDALRRHMKSHHPD